MQKTSTQKFFALLLAMMMVIGMLPTAVFAEEAVEPFESTEGSAPEADAQKTAAYPTYPDTVPEDWTNDLWLQYDHKPLKVDETAVLFPRRVPQIIDDPFSNRVMRPNFHFTLVEGDSVTLSATEGDQATVTAVKPGTSVVMVSYDALTAYGVNYGASSVVNTAYVVYTVGETGTAEPVIGGALAGLTSYDTLYYTEDNYPLTFTATAEGAESIAVTCNGEELTPDGESYTAKLTNRSNIIGVVATDQSGSTKSCYKVVDARKIEISITNKTYPGFAPAVGDRINVSFKGITMPIYKLAAIYNPCANSNWGVEEHPEWDTTAAYVSYQNADLGEFKGKCGQWDLAANNDFDIVAAKGGTYEFTGGTIKGDVYANHIGDDRTTGASSGSNVGSDYPIQHYTFSKLPSFSLTVEEKTAAVKLENIAFGKSAITLYKDERLTEDQILERLGGMTFSPANATNRSYTWSTSDLFTLNLSNGFYAQQLTGAEMPVTLTATAADGGKTAVCAVTIVEKPADEAQKAALVDKIAEAEKVKQVNETEAAWKALKTAIQTSNGILAKADLTGKEAEQAVSDLTAAIAAYKKAVDNLTTFSYTIGQEKAEGGTKITVTFPNMPAELGDKNTTSLKLVYKTNIPLMETVGTAECRDSKDLLKTFSFVVPDTFSGAVMLTGGNVREDRTEYPWGPQWPSEKTVQHYLGELPDITLNVDGSGSITPPNPTTEKKTAVISVDKLTIGGGYVVKRTEVSFSDGESVWDATKRVLDEKGIPYDFSFSSKYDSVYVSLIDGDGEFDHGPGSGWMYSVNGTYPQIGCSAYTLTAGDVIRWRYTTNLGQDIGGAPSSGGTPDGTTSGAADTLCPEASVSNGSAIAEVTDKAVTAAVSAVKDKADAEIVVAPTGADSAKSLTAKLSTSAVKSVANDSAAALTVKTAVGNVSIPHAALRSIASQASGSDVQISVAQKTASDVMNQTAHTKDAIIVAVTVTSNGKAITTFDGNSLSVSIPVGSGYTEGTSYNVIVISDDGRTETLVGKCVRKDSGLLMDVSTTHLSTFVVTRQKVMSFTDVADSAWYYHAVQYAFENGLFSGTSETKFSPNVSMTRAMLVTVLYRMEGSPAVTGTGSFKDVKAGQYYTDAVNWAAANKIVTGTSAAAFTPDAPITREQMAAILYRYAQVKELDVSVGKRTGILGFDDAMNISEYAVPAMQWAVGTGIVSGTTGTTLSPGGMATRAQVATILMRFQKNTDQ